MEWMTIAPKNLVVACLAVQGTGVGNSIVTSETSTGPRESEYGTGWGELQM